MTRQFKWIILLVLITVGYCFIGCGGNTAQETFDTAKLEELQNNPEHALILYQEIVEKYPDTPLAAKARERISVLKQQQ